MTRRRRVQTTQELSLFASDENGDERFSSLPSVGGTPCFEIDIPDSIPALGYGSHQWFRYYGKFPSVLGREIVRRHALPGRAVLDNYSGSGTTQVEAQIAGHESFGIDINPLAVLAANVKTEYYEITEIRDAADRVLTKAHRLTEPEMPPSIKPNKVEKWFTPSAANGLARLRLAVLDEPEGQVRDFLTTCFLAIVRRCSTAYDGEVRPHVNPEKRPREPLKAFSGKLEDMLVGLKELDHLRPPDIRSRTWLGDNRSSEYYEVIDPGSVGLVVSHPPYLNSFNYLQVFSLEFMWAEGFSNLWGEWDQQSIRSLELRAHPATNDALVTDYYDGVSRALLAASDRLCGGGVLAVVVGDATIRTVLEPVHLKIWEHLKDRGLVPQEIWYRTTHYGIGKYAYKHRADYHGEDAEKKDAVLFLRKPA